MSVLAWRVIRRSAAGFSPLGPLIDQYVNRLRLRERDSMYVYITERRLRRLVHECGWLTVRSIRFQSLQQWLSEEHLWRGRPISARTKNQFVDTAAEFCGWLCRPDIGRLPTNPLRGIERLRAKHNAHYRRAGTLAELHALLQSCPPSHRRYYLFRIYTPLRRKTLRRVTWGMLHLKAAPPFLATPAEINKSRKDEKHVLRSDVADLLRIDRIRAASDELVFPDAPTLRTFKIDLARAGIRFCDGRGNHRFDFHALRRTLVKLAKASGLSLDEASLLLGHKNSATTKKYYDEDSIDPNLGLFIERLPPLAVRAA